MIPSDTCTVEIAYSGGGKSIKSFHHKENAGVIQVTSTSIDVAHLRFRSVRTRVPFLGSSL